MSFENVEYPATKPSLEALQQKSVNLIQEHTEFIEECVPQAEAFWERNGIAMEGFCKKFLTQKQNAEV